MFEKWTRLQYNAGRYKKGVLMAKDKQYAAIDLKSFYASVECIERGLNPLETNLVVADAARTEKTICLAVSPSLKSYGIPGRPRLFEVMQAVKRVNQERHYKARRTIGGSFNKKELDADLRLAVEYIIATPRMAKYMEYSNRVFEILLRYIAPEDIHVYSIDEAFFDMTPYLSTYRVTGHDFVMQLIREILKETGITATAGIGSNLYLAKIAMDILAKQQKADSDGVRIAQLDEQSYRETMWCHQPITDFWRVGKGYAKRLAEYGLYTMGDIARCSVGDSSTLYNEDLLYRLFGKNAELLIDHAWGYEPTEMKHIKAYKPSTNSIGVSQVLQDPYTTKAGRLVVWEMADSLATDLVTKNLVTDQIVLTIGYDIENMTDPKINYKGPVSVDPYGRAIPKSSHGTISLKESTMTASVLLDHTMELFDRIIEEGLLLRRFSISYNHVKDASKSKKETAKQWDLFQYADVEKTEEEEVKEQREITLQKTVASLKQKFGKNAVLKGASLQEEGTAKDRNQQIGGHKA